MRPQVAQQKVNDITAPITPRRNHLSSSQQLLVKQTIALKKSIDFKRFENRIAAVNHEIALSQSPKHSQYNGFIKLLDQAEEDVAQLKIQGTSTQQLMLYFSKRHKLPGDALANQLKSSVTAIIDGLDSLKTQFLKIHGPGLFRMSGSLDVERFDEWVIELANIYQSGHSALHHWHREASEKLNAGA